MKRVLRAVAYGIAAVAVLAVHACAPPDATDTSRQRLSDAGLEVESSWVLVSGDAHGEPLGLLPDRPITLLRVEVGVEGQSSCNRYYSDPMEAEPATGLLFPSLVNEEKSCSDPDQSMSENPVMVLEEEYLGALRASTDIEVTSDRLRILGPTSTLVFEPMTQPGP